ncbi:MAG: hypothetical protein OEX02_19590, partial [Cyclobacteriaceae bacterium]|nr:hypothetical protein [Cyclobacteriaceae bacterium]
PEVKAGNSKLNKANKPGDIEIKKKLSDPAPFKSKNIPLRQFVRRKGCLKYKYFYLPKLRLRILGIK